MSLDKARLARPYANAFWQVAKTIEVLQPRSPRT